MIGSKYVNKGEGNKHFNTFPEGRIKTYAVSVTIREI